MNDVNTVAKVLVSLHKRDVLCCSPAFIADLEREFEFPERSLDNAIDDILVPKPRVEVVGAYFKVYHNGLLYYINSKLMSKRHITTAYMNTNKSMLDASVVIDMNQRSYIKNLFGIQQLTDAFFGEYLQ